MAVTIPGWKYPKKFNPANDWNDFHRACDVLLGRGKWQRITHFQIEIDDELFWGCVLEGPLVETVSKTAACGNPQSTRIESAFLALVEVAKIKLEADR